MVRTVRWSTYENLRREHKGSESTARYFEGVIRQIAHAALAVPYESGKPAQWKRDAAIQPIVEILQKDMIYRSTHAI